MRLGILAAAFAAPLVVSAALADIAPTPDRGPPIGDAGGLTFMVQSVQVEFGPANGPHYYKTEQVVVLTGCAEGTPNCALARAKNLVGMEVDAVDGARAQAGERHGQTDPRRLRRRQGAGDDRADPLRPRRRQPAGRGQVRAAVRGRVGPTHPRGPCRIAVNGFRKSAG